MATRDPIIEQDDSDSEIIVAPILNFSKKYHSICTDINRLSYPEIKCYLSANGKCSEGCIEVLNRRVKNLVPKPMAYVEKPQPDYYLVLDFECTCDYPKPKDFKHEIIEFPIILLNRKTLEIESEFHSFCRPIINPELTKFCFDLTGITQKQVDNAPTFNELQPVLNQWMAEKVYAKNVSFAFATDGIWDFDKFLSPQCQYSKISYPDYAKEWVDVRKHFSRCYGITGSISFMMECLGRKFDGRMHSGLDDARNVAKILIQMLKDGNCMSCNRVIGK